MRLDLAWGWELTSPGRGDFPQHEAAPKSWSCHTTKLQEEERWRLERERESQGLLQRRGRITRVFFRRRQRRFECGEECMGRRLSEKAKSESDNEAEN